MGDRARSCGETARCAGWAAWLCVAALGVPALADAQAAGPSLTAARALYDAGDYGTALVFYERASQEDPQSAPAFAGVGRTRLKLGDPAGAAQAYEAAVRLAPNVASLHRALQLARASAARVAPIAPIAPPPPTAQAPIAAAPGAAPATAASPAAGAAEHRRKGMRHYESKRYLFALRSFEQAAVLEPDNAENHVWLGQSHLALRRPAEAAQAYRAAARVAPNSIEIALALASALAENREWEEARRSYERALELSPGDPRAKKGLAAMKKRTPAPAALAPAPAPPPEQAAAGEPAPVPEAAPTEPAAPAPAAAAPSAPAEEPTKKQELDGLLDAIGQGE